ncbi:MAG: OmpA family protein [Nannocystaceae bacterium]
MSAASRDPARAVFLALSLALAFAGAGCERAPAAASRAPEAASPTASVRDDASAQVEPEGENATTSAVTDAAARAEPEARVDSDPDSDPDPCANTTDDLLAILGPIEGLVFAYDKAVIRPQSYPALDRIAAVLRDNPAAVIHVEGHRDEDPHWRERAVEITQRRASAVREYLIAQGIAPERLEARGFGPTRPRAPNDSKANRALNRRVELRAPALEACASTPAQAPDRAD